MLWRVDSEPAYVVEAQSVCAVVDGRPVGQADLWPEPEPGVVTAHLRVDRAWRRRGIGTRLRHEISALAAAAGAAEMRLCTLLDDDRGESVVRWDVRGQAPSRLGSP